MGVNNPRKISREKVPKKKKENQADGCFNVVLCLISSGMLSLEAGCMASYLQLLMPPVSLIES